MPDMIPITATTRSVMTEYNESLTWTCGKRPSVSVETVGCGHVYERPKSKPRRRLQRINESRTTTCPNCGHKDALYGRRR